MSGLLQFDDSGQNNGSWNHSLSCVASVNLAKMHNGWKLLQNLCLLNALHKIYTAWGKPAKSQILPLSLASTLAISEKVSFLNVMKNEAMFPGQDCETDCYWKLEGLMHFHLEQLGGKWTFKMELDQFMKRIVWYDCMSQQKNGHSDIEIAPQLWSWVLFLFCGGKKKKNKIIGLSRWHLFITWTSQLFLQQQFLYYKRREREKANNIHSVQSVKPALPYNLLYKLLRALYYQIE